MKAYRTYRPISSWDTNHRMRLEYLMKASQLRNQSWIYDCYRGRHKLVIYYGRNGFVGCTFIIAWAHCNGLEPWIYSWRRCAPVLFLQKVLILNVFFSHLHPHSHRVKCFPGSVRETRMATISQQMFPYSPSLSSLNPSRPCIYFHRFFARSQMIKKISPCDLFLPQSTSATLFPQLWLFPICTLICPNCNFSPIHRASDILNPIFKLSHTLTLVLLPSVRPITFSFRS